MFGGGKKGYKVDPYAKKNIKDTGGYDPHGFNPANEEKKE